MSGYQSHCLSLIQQYLHQHSHPHVLDLGGFTHTKLQYLSKYPCKINMFDLAPDNAYSCQDYPNDKYDVIFCWDLLDYVPTSTLSLLLEYLNERSNPHALLYFFTRTQSTMPLHPSIFDMFESNKLIISNQHRSALTCPQYSTIAFQKNLNLFHHQHSYLLKNGLQEHLWMKTRRSDFCSSSK